MDLEVTDNKSNVTPIIMSKLSKQRHRSTRNDKKYMSSPTLPRLNNDYNHNCDLDTNISHQKYHSNNNRSDSDIQHSSYGNNNKYKSNPTTIQTTYDYDYIYVERRILPINDLLATRMAERYSYQLIQSLFINWRNYIFRLFYIRNTLVENFRFQCIIKPIFKVWRRFCHIHHLLSKIVRCHWRRKIHHSFYFWKWGTKWRRNKYIHSYNAFQILHRHQQYQKYIMSKWKYLLQNIQARKIQRFYIRYHYRKLFWAIKTIKIFIMNKNIFRLLRMRKRKDKKRQHAENETVSILLRRSQGCIDDFLSNDNEHGQEMLAQYVQSVADVLTQIDAAPNHSQIKNTKMFPLKSNELSMCWTNRYVHFCKYQSPPHGNTLSTRIRHK